MNRLILALLMMLVAGCARTQAVSVVSGLYDKQEAGLGKTVVLSRFTFEATGKDGKDKADFGRAELKRLFDGLPEAEVVDAGPLVAALGDRQWRDASDLELVQAARAAGVDSVAEVVVEDFGGTLGIGLPVLWKVNTHYAYRLRLLDARTGTLLLDAHRAKDTGGPYVIRGRADLRRDFSQDLAALLAVPAPAGGRTAK